MHYILKTVTITEVKYTKVIYIFHIFKECEKKYSKYSLPMDNQPKEIHESFTLVHLLKFYLTNNFFLPLAYIFRYYCMYYVECSCYYPRVSIIVIPRGFSNSGMKVLSFQTLRANYVWRLTLKQLKAQLVFNQYGIQIMLSYIYFTSFYDI